MPGRLFSSGTALRTTRCGSLTSGGFLGRPIPIPFYWIDQFTADSTGSLLAAFGSLVLPGRAGSVAPVGSCLIDANSGELWRLPHTAVAIEGDSIYFVRDRALTKMSSQLPGALARCWKSQPRAARAE